MSQKRTVRVINPDGAWGWTSEKKAKEMVSRGRARHREDGMYEFIPDDPTPPPSCPYVPDYIDLTKRRTPAPLLVSAFSGSDSGRDGFMRYPHPQMTTSGSKWLAF